MVSPWRLVASSTCVLATVFAFQPILTDSSKNQRLRLVARADASKSSTVIRANNDDVVVDVVVIGSGIGGLSCASLLAMYGFDTLCVEAHDTAGGVAHSFVRNSSAGAFCFDSGPSLISGLSSPNTNNPLRQVIDALEVADEITWKTYDGWMIHDYADGTSFKLTTGARGEWEKALEEKAGKTARQEFEAFKKEMLVSGGLSES
jgi:monoamine oxidase